MPDLGRKCRICLLREVEIARGDTRSCQAVHQYAKRVVISEDADGTDRIKATLGWTRPDVTVLGTGDLSSVEAERLLTGAEIATRARTKILLSTAECAWVVHVVEDPVVGSCRTYSISRIRA